MKLKINDTVKIISGDDKGQAGKISKIYPETKKILIDGINTYKKHVKNQDGQSGGMVTLSRPLHANKVQIICPNCNKASRISYSGVGREKVRICKKCNKPITNNTKTTKKKK